MVLDVETRASCARPVSTAVHNTANSRMWVPCGSVPVTVRYLAIQCPPPTPTSSLCVAVLCEITTGPPGNPFYQAEFPPAGCSSAELVLLLYLATPDLGVWWVCTSSFTEGLAAGGSESEVFHLTPSKLRQLSKLLEHLL